ncbi:hypothetical protein [Arthrobacter sp. zg-Y1110]|uniref:hypothetical protein n=1 Tax=Arthrobacter sp. zg-Y1110 TaxID=2886932 RepID=UPI001D1517AF|nr:hypothetical protein [Arthrobacter sp. zg-Y1110]MCC3292824.1 hypothetical protein [Arthrobacter sp. zg-Y1110]UWX86763.1 hypothetical protein N2K99_18140 [Arthrobacter sp. zg-Y1110]
MAESPQSPVLTFIKEKALIIAVVILIAAAAVYIGVTRTGDSDETATVQPTAAPTAVLGGGPEGPTASPTGSGSPEATEGAQDGTGGPDVSTPQPSETPELEIHVGNNQQAIEETDWRVNADAFSEAWANPEGGKEAWLKRLRPYVTDELYKSFGYTDIRNIPSDTLRSNSPMEEGGGTLSFQAIYADGGNRFNGLMQIQPDGTWLMSTIGPGEG